jgi:GxxExxY protein
MKSQGREGGMMHAQQAVFDPQSEAGRARANELSGLVIGAAIEVHRHLGPGLLESAYEACLAHELSQRNIPFERQAALHVNYKGIPIDCGYRLDLLVAGLVIVELKAVDEIRPIHEAQILSYLRLKSLWLGLLLNFNVVTLKNGIHRFINSS